MRVKVYIDNSNVFKNIRKVRENTKDYLWPQLYDPLALATVLAGNRDLVGVNFYCVPPPTWLLTEGEKSKRKHAVAMKYYSTIEKLPGVALKYGYLLGDKDNAVEKNIDTQMSTDMVADAALGLFDTAILISNDGDFTSAIQNVKRLGKRVEVVFFKGYLSGSLRMAADLTRRARRSNFRPIDLSS